MSDRSTMDTLERLAHAIERTRVHVAQIDKRLELLEKDLKQEMADSYVQDTVESPYM